MDSKMLWEELNNLYMDQDKIVYEDINEITNESPNKMVTYLDGLFASLSIERMKQLAEVYKLEEINISYFTIDRLKYTWKLMRIGMNCSDLEYTSAVGYCNISEKKFKQNLSIDDAKNALHHMTFIAEIWVNQKRDFQNKQNMEPQALYWFKISTNPNHPYFRTSRYSW